MNAHAPSGQPDPEHIFAELGPAPDEDQHRRVLTTLAYLRG